MTKLFIYGVLFILKLELLWINIKEPFEIAYIYFKNSFLEPVALVFKLYSKGYGNKRDKIQPLLYRWNRFCSYKTNQRIKQLRRDLWNRAAKLQEETGIRINLL